MDFYNIREHSAKNNVIEIYPDFKVMRSKDLMTRGKAFYAIWDVEGNIWSTDEYDVQRIIDRDLMAHKAEVDKRNAGITQVKTLGDFSSNSWLRFRQYIAHLTDNYVQLDEKLTFANTEVKKTDYVSRRLPYPLLPGDFSAWDEVLSTLYEPEERAKIEWAIGAILSGDSKKIHKFLVFYGAPGTGKGTVLDVISKLFEGYTATFEANMLTSSSAFATEAFKSNPLVAIDPDGDLSKIVDNTRLNSIVSHEPMTINEKHKPSYSTRINSFLLIATNKPVKFTDAKSGLIRRMIDVRPSGAKLSTRKYHTLVGQMDFELGAIASHCLEVYREMGKDYYSGYTPVEMMLQTDVFFNFIEAYYDVFREQDGVSLIQAHEMYKEFCNESDLEFKMPRHKLREELKNYFDEFEERAVIDNVRVRSWFSGFNADRFKVKAPDEKAFSLVMDDDESIFDTIYMDQPAQYAGGNDTPGRFWTNAEREMTNPATGKKEMMVPPPHMVVDTTLKDLDTSRTHYVKLPENHIVIDFDLKDASGNKSAERNLEAASKWPPTYAEFSKSGNGVHLHYVWEGDATQLNRVYDDGIEVKVFTGNSSLRRRLSKCNNIPVAKLNTGIPLKEKKMISSDTIQSEKSLRNLIQRNIEKEFHGSTKPSIDFIKKILDDAYAQGLPYDVTDMRQKLLLFANGSSNNAPYCISTVLSMKFKSEVPPEEATSSEPIDMKDDRIVFYDVEVFPNLFVICWKFRGSPDKVRMINPSPQAVEELIRLKLVGFNNRKYDNHLLYARMLGYNNMELYLLSKKIIVDKSPHAMFGEAYGLAYTDIYDFASVKKGLKKWQIELGLKHDELGFDWDQPVPEADWNRVAEYCENDLDSTEFVFEHCYQDFIARQILSDLSGLPMSATTLQHTSKIVFGDNKRPQEHFKYTDLSEMFEGYKYEGGKSTYKGEITGEGGYVYAEPGMYTNVALLDVASMHPTSIEQLDLFGDYTQNFWQLVEARLAIKGKDFEKAKGMLNGKLAAHLKDPKDADALAYALKIVVNIVYGLTSAKFDNPFRDPKNIDNIVAKRGALFMIDLKNFVQSEGFVVAHIKTDSIKIPDATDEIIAKVMDFGKRYGYTFEHEATYAKFALVNDAVYAAKVGWAEKASKIGTWETVGAQFQIPYVKKKLFTKEPIEFRDLCVEKHVTTALYLDFGSVETMATVSKHLQDKPMQFVGKGGTFCPIKPDCGGGLLVREKDGKFFAATGSKGYFWLESDMVKTLKREDDIDMTYFDNLVNEAYDTLGKWGDAEWFLAA